MDNESETNNPLHWAAGYQEKGDDEQFEIRPLADMERAYIEMVISLCHGNIPKAAGLLEISPSTIYRKQSQWVQKGA